MANSTLNNTALRSLNDRLLSDVAVTRVLITFRTPAALGSSVPAAEALAMIPPPYPEFPPAVEDIDAAALAINKLYVYIQPRMRDGLTGRQRRAALYDKLLAIGEDYWDLVLPHPMAFEELMNLRTTTRPLPSASSEPESNVTALIRKTEAPVWGFRGKEIERAAVRAILKLVIAAKVDAMHTVCARTYKLGRLRELILCARTGWDNGELRWMKASLTPLFEFNMGLLRAVVLGACEDRTLMEAAACVCAKVGELVACVCNCGGAFEE